MRNLAVIPARSGSKGVPDKNIKLLNGKPLMAYSIESAYSSRIFDTVHVSTDSEVYRSIAREYHADVPFLRSMETASDTASSWDVVLEVLGNYRQRGKTFDTVTLLQPTSPLRISEDILCAYDIMAKKHAEAVVSVCETDHTPLWCNILPENGCMDGFIRLEDNDIRQVLKKYYRVNGAIYTITVPALQKSRKLVYGPGCFAYVMPKERSVDIDETMDFLVAGVLLQDRR